MYTYKQCTKNASYFNILKNTANTIFATVNSQIKKGKIKMY